MSNNDKWYWYHYDNRKNMNNDYPYNQYEDEDKEDKKDSSSMYHRDHIKAFNNAKAKGLEDPEKYMYMYSQNNRDYFKNINFRNYISFAI